MFIPYMKKIIEEPTKDGGGKQNFFRRRGGMCSLNIKTTSNNVKPFLDRLMRTIKRSMRTLRLEIEFKYSKHYEISYRILLNNLHKLQYHFQEFLHITVPLLASSKMAHLTDLTDCFGRRLDRIQNKILDTWPTMDMEEETVLRNFEKIKKEIEDTRDDGVRIAFVDNDYNLQHIFDVEHIYQCRCSDICNYFLTNEVRYGIHRNPVSRRKSF